MLSAFTFVYILLFSAVANCFLLFDSLGLRIVCIVLFFGINMICGLFLSGSKNMRLRLLCHGATALSVFCVSTAISLVLHFWGFFQMLPAMQTRYIHSLIYCIVCHFILFWNGMICVYVTSLQLGIKLRVIGLMFGMIPIVNFVILCVILVKSYHELSYETEKERINRSRKEQKLCQTKYPILLVHGVFYRDNRLLNYWGRIPGELEANGAACYYGNHQSARAVRDSAAELSARIREIVMQTGCEKVNIIAHSKGGLDCRCAIANCGIAEYVASLTTINTPHRGCTFADWLLQKAPDALERKVSAIYNAAARNLGDTRPDFLAAVYDLTAAECRKFDANTPVPAGIYTQSVGSVMNRARSGQFPFNLSYRFARQFDGKNDGLVGVDSFAWGSRYTLLDLPVKRGISHLDITDIGLENLKGFDVREFYVNLVADLKQRGL